MTLTCPDPPNMAAIAKQLHKTALQVEADIFAIEQTMRGAVNLPVVVLTSTANHTGLSSGVDNDLSSATFATSFDNTAGLSGSGTGAFGPDNFGFFTNFLGEGLYEIGMCLTAVASGAVDDNSFRQFRIDHLRPDPNSVTGETRLQQASFLMFESNTGVGSEVSFAGHFRARPQDRFGFFLQHGNSSSTLTVNSGMIIWGAKLSESTLTRVL